MDLQELFMERAMQLAENGRGWVSPNPMVGCVIVSGTEIIGEGWHRRFGKVHAEVEAVNDALSRGLGHRLEGATAYVSLEPCSHYGKTPPCADLLISSKIGQVIVSNEDPNPVVSGKGMARLSQAGIRVVPGVLKEAGEELNKRFFCGVMKKRPYVILKWAESRDGYLSLPGQRVKISSSLTDILVHKWRSEEDAILVGKNTVLSDNPSLNVRHWTGRNPVRVVLDRRLQTAVGGYNVFDGSQPAIFVNLQKESAFIADRYEDRAEAYEIGYLKVSQSANELSEMLEKLYSKGIGSVLVEGGTQVLTAFILAGLWDEMRVIKGSLLLGRGVRAPRPEGILLCEKQVGSDRLFYFNSPK